MRIFKLPKVDSIEDRRIDTSPKATETKYDKTTHKAAEKTRLDADMERSRLVCNVESLTQPDIAVVAINRGNAMSGDKKGVQISAQGEVDIAN